MAKHGYSSPIYRQKKMMQYVTRITVVLPFPLTSDRLIDFQKELLNHNIKALVGLRQETGYFTAETFIYNYEKATAGKPHFDRVFSPFGFATYEEALKKSIEQGFDNFSITQPKI